MARERLFDAIERLDTRAKSWARGALQTTRVSGWGLAGAVALWAGVALITRPRPRSAPKALMLRVARPQPRATARVAIYAVRAAAACVGFLASRAWATRWLAQHRAQSAPDLPRAPQPRRLGAGEGRVMFAERASDVERRGTPNA
jgi:hypothetical protein